MPIWSFYNNTTCTFFYMFKATVRTLTLNDMDFEGQQRHCWWPLHWHERHWTYHRSRPISSQLRLESSSLWGLAGTTSHLAGRVSEGPHEWHKDRGLAGLPQEWMLQQFEGGGTLARISYQHLLEETLQPGGDLKENNVQWDGILRDDTSSIAPNSLLLAF